MQWMCWNKHSGDTLNRRVNTDQGSQFTAKAFVDAVC